MNLPATNSDCADLAWRSGSRLLDGGAVEIIRGPYRSRKTEWIIDELIDHCRLKPLIGATVLVPSQRYHMLFEKSVGQSLLEESGMFPLPIQGVVGLRVGTFYGLCQQVLRKAGAGFKIIPEKIRTVLVARVLNRLSDSGELTALKPIAGCLGTHLSILELIDEFERAALSPDDVLTRLEETARSESRYVELARIYQEYWRELDRLGYIDQRRLAFTVQERLSGKHIANLSLGFLAVDGFDRFNPLQLQVLSVLSLYATRTAICFDYAGDGGVAAEDYAWKESSNRKLIEIFGKEHTIRDSATLSFKRPATVDRCRQMEKFRAPDRFLEMEEIARRIKRALVLDGIRPERILVVARSLSPYKAAIPAAFECAGLNYHVDEPVSIAALPMVQLVRQLLKLGLRDFRRAEVIACLKSPYFKQSTLHLSISEVEHLERLSLVHNVVGGANQWNELITGEGQCFTEDFRERMREFLDYVTPPREGPVGMYVQWFEDILDWLLVTRHDVRHQDDSRDPFDVLEERQALTEVRRALAAFIHEETILGISHSSGEEFVGRLDSLIEQASLRRLPRCRDAITICGADLAPNQSFDYVFIAGLCEGEFPRRASRGGFANADELSRWASLGVDINNPRFHSSFEPALFTSLSERATTRLVLSCPDFEITGEELTPSFLVAGGSVNELETIPSIMPFQQSARGAAVGPRCDSRIILVQWQLSDAGAATAVPTNCGPSRTAVRARRDGAVASSFFRLQFL